MIVLKIHLTNLRYMQNLREKSKFWLKPIALFNSENGLKPAPIDKMPFIDSIDIQIHISQFTIHFQKRFNFRKLFNNSNQNKTYIINRQKSLNLPT